MVTSEFAECDLKSTKTQFGSSSSLYVVHILGGIPTKKALGHPGIKNGTIPGNIPALKA